MSIRDDLRDGREMGVPLCCRVVFAISWRFFPYHGQSLHRGVRFNDDREPYVPCGVFHRADMTHDEWQRRLNVDS